MKKSIEKHTEKRAVMPLLSWDIFSQFGADFFLKTSRKEHEISQLNQFSSKYKWKIDVERILKTSSYEALVLTDTSKKILWVNDGFTEMTGYSKEFAKNKRPTFLQGKNSHIKRQAIRKKLATELPFKEVIINYRKDGTPYDCEIYIIPLKTDKTTHYLALERAV